MTRFIIFIFCSATIASCYDPENYDNITEGNIIKFTTRDTTVIADGKTSANVKVQISDRADQGRRRVKFKTDFGKFRETNADTVTITADSAFFAAAHLVSADTGFATISATIHGIQATTNRKVVFSRALPDTIIVQVPAFELVLGFDHNIIVTASLSRDDGSVPSSGLPVAFRAIDGAGHDVGHFLNNQSTSKTDSKGNAIITFSAGDDTAIGFIGITATAKSNDGTTTGETILHITEDE